ncbi:MAG: hypothetical protein HW421_4136 [Ignavibacteria bacterium]|nr:hypothetical protein [Ignavibacteria bacterium]
MKKIKYNSDVDALLVELNDLPIDYAEQFEDLIIHYTKEGLPVLLEVLGAKKLSLNIFDSIVNNREVVFG